jgi:hypothetical protein
MSMFDQIVQKYHLLPFEAQARGRVLTGYPWYRPAIVQSGGGIV